jgi:hypothetical protein
LDWEKNWQHKPPHHSRALSAKKKRKSARAFVFFSLFFVQFPYLGSDPPAQNASYLAEEGREVKKENGKKRGGRH